MCYSESEVCIFLYQISSKLESEMLVRTAQSDDDTPSGKCGPTDKRITQGCAWGHELFESLELSCTSHPSLITTTDGRPRT